MGQGLINIIEIIAYSLVLLVVAGIVYVMVLYVIDVTQTRHTIRRNYPVIGRLRYVFENLGVFLRQYFFAMDRDELPFNRAQRSWVYRAAKNIDNTVAFGSTRDLRQPGAIFFVNCPYPILEQDIADSDSIVFGPTAKEPYATSSIFNISGMSFGALSKPAVIALSNGARMAGCWLNTGEGGLAPYHLEGGADIVFQIGTAKNGVRTLDGALDEKKLQQLAAHPQLKMFEIKLSQGAKPGKGGILPGAKVSDEIAKVRGVRAGEDAISPNRHPEIDSDASLLDFVARIKGITGKPVGCKFVLGASDWLDSLLREIKHRGAAEAPDFFAVDGAEGGTGAAPMSLIDNLGLPLRESLPMVVDKLKQYGLKERIRVVAAGKLITATEVAHALCLGADAVVSARGFMFALGCVQALQCNKNTCPTGVTTHDARLQRGLHPMDKAVRVANYVRNIHKEVSVIAHSCGVREARGLKRMHAREVVSNLNSVSLDELFPEVTEGQAKSEK